MELEDLHTTAYLGSASISPHIGVIWDRKKEMWDAASQEWKNTFYCRFTFMYYACPSRSLHDHL